MYIYIFIYILANCNTCKYISKYISKYIMGEENQAEEEAA